MVNGKYSKVLSIALAVGIIIIIGLLIFIGIDWFKASRTVSSNENIFEQFNNYIEKNNSENNQNLIDTNITNSSENKGLIDTNITQEENSTTGGGNTSSGGGKNLTLNGLEVAGTIEIPKTKVKCAILNDSSARALETGIAILYGPGVNKIGNTVLAGHNYRNGTFFSNNKKLAIGDKIYLTDTSGKKVTYTIYKKYQTDANDFSYATRDTNGLREISVSTCTDDSSARLILWAKEGN